MWILHQDKEIILNIDNAVSVEYSFNALLKKEHGIAYCADNKVINSCIVMGIYPSKERCLEVIQEVSVEYSFNALLKKEHGIAYCADNKVINSCIVMGIYPSKERCLEVIQDIIKNIHLKNPTYEMPEK